MKTTVSLIALLIVLAFMLALAVVAYIEAWDTLKYIAGLSDGMIKAVASCLLVLLSVLLVMLSASIAAALYYMLSGD